MRLNLFDLEGELKKQREASIDTDGLKKIMRPRFRDYIIKPENVLTLAANTEALRRIVDSPPLSSQIDHDDSDFLLGYLMNCFYDAGQKCLQHAKEHPELPSWAINHYRVLNVVDHNEFKEMVRRRPKPKGMFGQFYERSHLGDHIILDAAGFFSHEDIRTGKALPSVYIRKELFNSRNMGSFVKIRNHEDAHAFSSCLQEPEEVWGFEMDKEGKREACLRYSVEEWIANIESGEPLNEGLVNASYLLEGHRATLHSKQASLLDVVDHSRNLMDVHGKDLAYILRVMPVQIMEDMLPKVVGIYLENIRSN